MTPALDRTDTHVRVHRLCKTFTLAEPGRPAGLREALWSARRRASSREVHALQNVSFTIERGERVGIIGRNGAGKTTLLSILAGIAAPSAGQVDVAGDVHAMLTIGAVLRDQATGRENIYLDGAVHGKSRDEIEHHMEEVIAFSELGEFIDRQVHTYSSGMKARLAFSMGAFIDPDILIIDETLSVGDAFFAAKASRRMKEITARGRIVIVVSHGLGAIEEICSRCLWLDQGRLVMDGPAPDVARAYGRAVARADEAELAAKFGQPTVLPRRAGAGRLAAMHLDQAGEPVEGTAKILMPLQLTASGRLDRPSAGADLGLSVLRVDGRRILEQRLSQQGHSLPQGRFDVSVSLDPMILGSGLYRFEFTLLDGDGAIDALHRVVELLDEEGQFGGVPLLIYPPLITSVRTGEGP